MALTIDVLLKPWIDSEANLQRYMYYCINDVYNKNFVIFGMLDSTSHLFRSALPTFVLDFEESVLSENVL